ncbi:hypothetical protein niasHT_024023 [Heterodera trifolii]|uniref:Uncharacterized protein n=1 Tax=Heterodera trifolii TaxID=157864 RepID=A0ABD2KPX3_9BILA
MLTIQVRCASSPPPRPPPLSVLSSSSVGRGWPGHRDRRRLTDRPAADLARILVLVLQRRRQQVSHQFSQHLGLPMNGPWRRISVSVRRSPRPRQSWDKWEEAANSSQIIIIISSLIQSHPIPSHQNPSITLQLSAAATGNGKT